MEAVHIELPDERGEIVVFEESREDFLCEADVVGDDEGFAVGLPADELVCALVVDHVAQFVQKGGYLFVEGGIGWAGVRGRAF